MDYQHRVQESFRMQDEDFVRRAASQDEKIADTLNKLEQMKLVNTDITEKYEESSARLEKLNVHVHAIMKDIKTLKKVKLDGLDFKKLAEEQNG